MSALSKLAARGHKGAQAPDSFDPDQARDEKGMWTAGAGGLKTGAGAVASNASMAANGSGSPKLHANAARLHYAAANTASRGSPERGFHVAAAQHHEKKRSGDS